MDKIESALILVALVSLWPLMKPELPGWYYGWLAVVLGGMVWVAWRRLGRVRAAVEEAKKRRDEAEKSKRPPWLG